MSNLNWNKHWTILTKSSPLNWRFLISSWRGCGTLEPLYKKTRKKIIQENYNLTKNRQNLKKTQYSLPCKSWIGTTKWAKSQLTRGLPAVKFNSAFYWSTRSARTFFTQSVFKCRRLLNSLGFLKQNFKKCLKLSFTIGGAKVGQTSISKKGQIQTMKLWLFAKSFYERN